MAKRRSKHSRRRSGYPTRPQAKRPHFIAKEPGVSSLNRLDLLLPILASLILAAAALPASGTVLGSYYSPRVAVFYPLVFVLSIACLVSLLRLREPVHLDLLDFAVISFVVWGLITAAAAPVTSLGWFGAYNRIGGAFFWLALGLLMIIFRRVFTERRAVETLVWIVCAVIYLAVGVAILQSIGVHTPWPYRKIWYGRVIGTTGNPLNLAGLCLLGIWLALLVRSRETSGRLRIAIALGTLLSALGLTLSVSRAAYLGVGLTVVFVIVAVALFVRWWWAAVALVAVVSILAGAAIVYQSSSTRSGDKHNRLSLSPGRLINTAVGDTRVTFWRIGMHAIAARPLLGYGPGGYLVAYRRYVPARRMQNRPLSGVTDPHSAVFVIVDGSGLPGFGLVLIGLLFAARLTWPRLRKELASLRNGERSPLAGSVLAPTACAVALLVFLAVSPSDPTALVPLALMTALATGPPRTDDHFAITLPPSSVFRQVEIAIAVVASAALVFSLYFGVQLLRADHAARQGAVAGDSQAAERSARLMPAVPTFDLLAWNAHLRQAIAAGNDREQAASGEHYLTQGLKDDPTDPMLRGALVRFEFMFADTKRAASNLEEGLRFNPTNPALQGLLGYLAQALAHDPHQIKEAQRLVSELRALPNKGADGWYWLSVAQTALGEDEAAAESRAEAHHFGPAFKPADFEKRVRGQF